MSGSLKLERQCRLTFPQKLGERLVTELQNWYGAKRRSAEDSIRRFQTEDIVRWPELILSHASSDHDWYNYLESNAYLKHFSGFYAEEAQMPHFVTLLEGVQGNMKSSEAWDAVAENLFDEQHPELHSILFDRLFKMLDCAESSAAVFDGSLADTNLVFYYGYFVDYWFAVGALYATELMLASRASKMLSGLRRLGIDEHALKFLEVHAESDSAHAERWLHSIIIPSASFGQSVLESISSGIGIRLNTSALYLNRLVGNLADS